MNRESLLEALHTGKLCSSKLKQATATATTPADNGKYRSIKSSRSNTVSTPKRTSVRVKFEIDISRQRILSGPKKKLFTTNKREGTQLCVTSWKFSSGTASTCPFFFTNQGIYLLVFSLLTIKQRITLLDYWVQQIRIQTQTSIPAADVYLVGTHRDDPRCTKEYISHIKSLLDSRYPSNRYPQIKAFYAVSNKTGKGLTTLLNALEKSSSFIQPVINPSWIDVHHHLLNIKSTSHYISWTDYVAIVTKIGIPPEQLYELTSFLCSTSTMLFCDNYAAHKYPSMVILDPLWLAKFVAALHSIKLDSPFTDMEEVLSKVAGWSSYDSQMQKTLIRIITRFYIVYRTQNNQILCPWMLPDNILNDAVAKENWPRTPPENVIQHGRVFDFDYIPLGFLERLISTSHLLPDVKLVAWSHHQLLFNYGTQWALVSFIPRRIDQRAYQYRIEARTVRDTTEEAVLFIARIHQFECLIESYYSRLKSTLNMWVVCSHCVSSERFRLDPYLFRYSQCVTKVIDSPDAFLYCRDIQCPRRAIRIDVIAPDITLSSMRKWIIAPSRLTTVRHLGDGATGEVELCLLDNKEKVAVKVLSTGQRDFIDEQDKNDVLVRLYKELTQEINLMM